MRIKSVGNQEMPLVRPGWEGFAESVEIYCRLPAMGAGVTKWLPGEDKSEDLPDALVEYALCACGERAGSLDRAEFLLAVKIQK